MTPDIASVLVNMLPSLIYSAHWVRNAAIGRSLEGVEVYALKIAHLVLPVSGRRIPAFAALKANYVALTPLNNENAWASLGIVGTIGFLASIAVVLCLRNGRRFVPSQIDAAARLTLAAVLVATIGGFSTLIGNFAGGDIRGYNRISVIIAFLSLFVVFALVRAIADRLSRGSLRIGYVLFVTALVVVGVLDQTTPAFVPDFEQAEKTFANDSRFVRRIEAMLPKGAMV